MCSQWVQTQLAKLVCAQIGWAYVCMFPPNAGTANLARHIPTQLWDTWFSQTSFPPNFETDDLRKTRSHPTLFPTQCIDAVWRDIWGGLGCLLRGLGRPWGGLGAVLAGSWAPLARSWGDILSEVIFDQFYHRFWSPKGCPKGGILGPKSSQNRCQN